MSLYLEDCLRELILGATCIGMPLLRKLAFVGSFRRESEGDNIVFLSFLPPSDF